MSEDEEIGIADIRIGGQSCEVNTRTGSRSICIEVQQAIVGIVNDLGPSCSGGACQVFCIRSGQQWPGGQASEYRIVKPDRIASRRKSNDVRFSSRGQRAIEHKDVCVGAIEYVICSGPTAPR